MTAMKSVFGVEGDNGQSGRNKLAVQRWGESSAKLHWRAVAVLQYFLLACDLLLWSSHAGQVFWCFSLNWLKCVSASPRNDSSPVCPDATKKLASLTHEPSEQPEEVFLPGFYPGVCSSFISALILIVGEVGVQLLRDGWSVSYKI